MTPEKLLSDMVAKVAFKSTCTFTYSVDSRSRLPENIIESYGSQVEPFEFLINLMSSLIGVFWGSTSTKVYFLAMRSIFSFEAIVDSSDMGYS